MKRCEGSNWASLLAAIVITACLAAPVAATAHDSRPNWCLQLGTSQTESASGVATDAAGNVYLTGSTGGALGGPHQGGARDIWVAKIDTTSHLVWKRQLGTNEYDTAQDIATDGNGNVYLTGLSAGPLGGPIVGDVTAGGDAWVAKYDAAGHRAWARHLGSVHYDTASSVATDTAGNVYLTGWTNGDLAGPNSGSSDVWVARYETTGRRIWKRQLDLDGSADFASGVATDAAGNVYLTGMSQRAPGGPRAGEYFAWVVKYDAEGHRVWKRLLDESDDSRASGVATATDPAGNIYVYLTGNTYSTLAGPNQGGLDAWVAKFDATGRRIWKRQLGTSSNDGGSRVATDAAGNVYLTGGTRGALGGPNQGLEDAWVAKYDASGRLKWKRQLGSNSDDGASGVATVSYGTVTDVYIAGGTSGALCGAPRGSVDAFVAKYSSAP